MKKILVGEYSYPITKKSLNILAVRLHYFGINLYFTYRVKN